MLIRTLSQVLADYEIALVRLETLGVRVEGTRLAKYKRILAVAVRDEAQGVESHQGSDEFRNALIESIDIIDIVALPDSIFSDEHTLLKLRSISSGREFMEEGQFDPARDYAFEFAVAAELYGRGRFGGFSAIGGDATIDDSQHPVECKRISSWAQLDRRVREASAQLVTCHLKGAPPGLIAVDATRPMQRLHGRIEAGSDEELGDIAEERVSAVVVQRVMHHVDIEKVVNKAALGLMVRCVSSGVAGGAAHVRRSTVWQACCLHDDGSPENDLFLELAGAFSGGPITHATEDDVARGRYSKVRT